MCINVDYSLQKSGTISPNVLCWTKGRMEQSRAEKIRRNNVFLLTLLTLHWIHLFTMARQNLLPIISILLRWILFFFFSSGQWIYSLKLSLWKYFSGIVAGNAPRSVTFNLLFLFICSQDSRGRVIEKKNKAANRWDQKRESWHPFKKWKMRLNGF